MKTINLKVETICCNPEDRFADLMREGYSIKDALKEIIEDELIEQTIWREYPDYIAETIEEVDNGEYKVRLMTEEELES